MFLLVKVMNSANNENMCKDVRRCDYLEGEGYLFDTNIWIHTIYMPYIYNSTEYMDVYWQNANKYDKPEVQYIY